MNEQSHMMNQNQANIMKQKQPIHQVVSQPQPLMQMMTQNQLPPPKMMSQSMPMPMMNRNYGIWPHPPPISNPAMDPMIFTNPFSGGMPSGLGRNYNWLGKKKGIDAQKDLSIRRNEKYQQQVPHNVNYIGGGYQPPPLLELQSQNWAKAKKYYNPKKKFNNRFAPYAPRNTSSFIIRAKKSGGIASLVSPSPATPAVLPTPVFSPSTEVLGDTAKEEWGVDGYGSMNGLIRLRSPGNGLDGFEDDGSSESDSDVEEHVEVERRLDHDLSRFEMIYPNGPNGDYNNLLENRVDDQDTHIAHLEEENLTLRERLFLMEREMRDLKRRLQGLERLVQTSGDANATEEVVENGSDNDAESSGRGELRQLGVGINEEMEYVDEHQKVDNQSYQIDNANADAQAVLLNQNVLDQYDNAEVLGKAVEENIEGEANMNESEIVPEQTTDVMEMSGR